MLTGIAVLLGQGTMGQLVLGVLLSATVLATTAGLRPYKRVEDDALAIVCQGAVVANLALAILLHSRRAQSDIVRLGFTDAAQDSFDLVNHLVFFGGQNAGPGVGRSAWKRTFLARRTYPGPGTTSTSRTTCSSAGTRTLGPG